VILRCEIESLFSCQNACDGNTSFGWEEASTYRQRPQWRANDQGMTFLFPR